MMENQNAPKVLFVDDERPILKSLMRFGRTRSWDVHVANSGDEGISLMSEEIFDVIVSDMRMPEMTGDVFLRHARELSPDSVRILLTGYSDIEAVGSAINHAKIYNYVTKPWNEESLGDVIDQAIAKGQQTRLDADRAEDSERQNKKLSKLALLLDKQVKERTIEIDQALGLLEGIRLQGEQNFYDSLNVLNQILEWKEGRDAGHSRFVSEYAEKVANRLDFDDQSIQELKLASMLHRIGILCLPDELRMRPVFSFDSEEKKLYQRYPIWSQMALSCASNLSKVGEIVRHHREAVNGSGFPDQITDSDIPAASKIISVVGDFYDAFNGRLERTISGVNEAKNYINQWVGKKYDTKIAAIFFDVLGDFGNNSVKKMTKSTGELIDGMTLDGDVVSKSQMLLLTKGTTLNEAMIHHLKEYEQQFNDTLEIYVQIQEPNDQEAV